MSYVLLPDIKKIEINNFDLYKESNFKKEFVNELNLFIGINGLGKTTTIKALAYGISGINKSNRKKEEKNRLDKRSKEFLESEAEGKEFVELYSVGIKEGYFNRYKSLSGDPTLYLEFSLGNNIFSLKRNMSTHKIEFLKINENIINDNLDEIYIKNFEALSGTKMDNFTKIFYTLLIRLEEAQSLLFRPFMQHNAIRTLLVDDEYFHVLFSNAENKLRAQGSNYRGLKDDLSKIKKQITTKEEQLTEIDENIDEMMLKISEGTKDIDEKKIKLEQHLQKLIDEKEKLKSDANESTKIINGLNEELKENINKKDNLEYELENMSIEVGELKKKIHIHLYSENDIYNLAINALNERQSCVFCNSKVDDNKIENLLKSINHNNCPFCKSNLNKELEDISYNSEDENKYNKLYEEKKKSEKLLVDLAKDINKIKDEIININNQNSSILNRIFSIDSEVQMVKTLINDLTINSSNEKIRELEIMLKNYKEEKSKILNSIEIDKKQFDNLSFTIYGCKIDFYKFNDRKYKEEDYTEGIVGGVFKKLSDARNEYKELQNKADNYINEIQNKLFEKFNKYNILSDFSLHKIKRRLETNIEVEYSFFVPKYIGEASGKMINEGIRETEEMVSKSEYVLLDYAFRLALVDLYMEISNNETFVAFETSEGVMDTIRIQQYACMLKQFVSYKNKMLCITNLNSEIFIKSLFEDTRTRDEKLEGIINFIDISSKAIENKDFYNEMINRIFS